MLIHNSEARIITVTGVVDKTNAAGAKIQEVVEVRLLPGLNEVPGKAFEAVKACPLLVHFLGEGLIKVLDQQGGKQVQLKDLGEQEAIKMASISADVELLEKWSEQETRRKVKAAIDKQLSQIKSKE